MYLGKSVILLWGALSMASASLNASSTCPPPSHITCALTGAGYQCTGNGWRSDTIFSNVLPTVRGPVLATTDMMFGPICWYHIVTDPHTPVVQMPFMNPHIKDPPCSRANNLAHPGFDCGPEHGLGNAK